MYIIWKVPSAYRLVTGNIIHCTVLFAWIAGTYPVHTLVHTRQVLFSLHTLVWFVPLYLSSTYLVQTQYSPSNYLTSEYKVSIRYVPVHTHTQSMYLLDKY